MVVMAMVDGMMMMVVVVVVWWWYGGDGHGRWQWCGLDNSSMVVGGGGGDGGGGGSGDSRGGDDDDLSMAETMGAPVWAFLRDTGARQWLLTTDRS